MKAVLYTSRCIVIGDINVGAGSTHGAELALSEGRPVRVENAWELVIVRSRSRDPATSVEGMQQSMLVLPLPPAAGALPSIYVRAESWMFPERNGMGPQVEQLLREAEASTLVERARASGIEFPPRRG